MTAKRQELGEGAGIYITQIENKGLLGEHGNDMVLPGGHYLQFNEKNYTQAGRAGPLFDGRWLIAHLKLSTLIFNSLPGILEIGYQLSALRQLSLSSFRGNGVFLFNRPLPRSDGAYK